MQLYQFPISHYCEKARWALDYKNLTYQQINLIPGLHRFVVKRKTAETSVPVLLNGSQAIQGSSKIIDYAERIAPHPTLGFSEASQSLEAIELEAFLDDQIGPLIRSIAYNVLFKHRKELTALWSHLGPAYGSVWLSLSLPFLIPYLQRSYDTTDASAQKQRDRFDSALDRLDTLYERSAFLVGDRFSRVDLTAAALLAPMVMPDQHPLPPAVRLPEEFERYRLQQIGRPVLQRVTTLYDEYRHANAAS